MKFGIREMVLLLVLLALPVASYILVFRPVNEQIDKAREEIAHKRSMLDKLREATARKQDLQRANDEIKAGIEAIEAQLPTDKELDDVVRQVSDLAVEAGLASPNLTTDKPVAAALYMEQPLKIKMAGDFKGFHDFLTRLEDLPRKTRISDMKVARDADVNGSMKAEFTLSIYFQTQGGAR
jgi:type IV pilus assembly protein PilO